MTSKKGKSEETASLKPQDMLTLPHELQVGQTDLAMRAEELSDLSDLKRAEERSRRLIDCLISMGVDTEANINRLVAFCGKTMGATSCLFNRVDHGLLCSVGQWQPPPGFKSSDKPDGHICYDVIKRADDKPFVIRNLPATDYARSDPIVAAFGLQTYVGVAVKCHGQAVGSLCVVYQDDVEPSADQLDYMCLLGFSIASEEERRRADEALRESALRFRNLLQDIPTVAVQGYGPDGTTQYWNQASERLYGYSAQEAIGRNLVDLIIPPEIREYVVLAIRQMAETGHSIPASEVSLMRKDGSRVSVFSSHVIVRVPGRQQELFCMDIDLTEHKAAAEALLQSEEKFRAIANYTVDWESWFGPDGKYLWVNPGVEQITGYSAEEVLAMPDFVTVLIAEEDRAVFKERFQEALQGSRNNDFEFRYRHKNGSKLWLSASWQPIFDAQGKPLGVRTSGRDVTARKQSEEEILKLQKLQSVGTLAGGIAHDFNNILQGLYGNISFAKDDLPKDHPAYASLEKAEKSMSRAVRLTKQLLTFAKGGAPVKEDVRLGTLVEEVARFDLSGSTVKLLYRQAEDLWPAKADKGQIQQVVSNLVLNARQAMPNGGCLTIALENADLPAEAVLGLRQGRYVKVTVRDEGVGIDPKVLGQIFDPYFTTKQTGSGLGLATAWSIINRHGGRIGVVSEPGKGTTFTIYLPASEASPVETQQPAEEGSAPEPARRPRILVMDDDETICDIASNMLTRSGYSVDSAPGGREAIGLYRQALEAGEPFDAVIMDLTIPGGIGGVEALKALRGIDPHVRAIVSSGYAEDPVMANFADYGFKGAVAKTYVRSELSEAVARVLR